MAIVRSREFTGTRAWDALPLAVMNGITVRLHWTDQPYPFHVNDGQEVFVVLEGTVDMRQLRDGAESVTVLEPGDIFVATIGTEHSASPRGEARILVVESEGSI